jgi:hypothetical protein
MLIHEAALIQTLIDQINPKSILDCGSGSRADRTIVQPHIGAIFADRGIDVVWTDMREIPGVIQCDYTKPDTLRDMPRCELVTCCSLLEHVEDISTALQAVGSLADDWLIVSVPWKFPKHDCPIDNGWRPSPNDLGGELKALGFRVVEQYASGPEKFDVVPDASASVVLARRE